VATAVAERQQSLRRSGVVLPILGKLDLSKPYLKWRQLFLWLSGLAGQPLPPFFMGELPPRFKEHSTPHPLPAWAAYWFAAAQFLAQSVVHCEPCGQSLGRLPGFLIQLPGLRKKRLSVRGQQGSRIAC
jgi:hypothetical protein